METSESEASISAKTPVAATSEVSEVTSRVTLELERERSAPVDLLSFAAGTVPLGDRNYAPYARRSSSAGLAPPTSSSVINTRMKASAQGQKVSSKERGKRDRTVALSSTHNSHNPVHRTDTDESLPRLVRWNHCDAYKLF